MRQTGGQADSPDRVTPVPDSFAGEVMPGGRGMETHGVSPVEHWTDSPGPEGTEEVFYEDREPEPEPIPVRIVHGESAIEIREWDAYPYPLPANPAPGQENGQRIAGRRGNRTTITVQNAGPGVVRLGPSAQVQPTTGIQVALNGSVNIDTTEDVWAILENPATAATLFITQTFTTKG